MSPLRLLALLVVFGSTPALAGTSPGAALYRRHCEGCHGPDGRGDGPDAVFLADPPRDLRDGVLKHYDTATVVQRISDGRPLLIARDPRTLDQWRDDTGALIDHVERIARTGPAVVDRGRRLWESRCARCHGSFGVPPDDAPNEAPADLSDPDVQRRFDDATLREAVRHGVPGMPAIDAPPTGGEVAPLGAYIRMFGPGLVLYGRLCAGCHGDDGRPVDLPGFRKPVVTFDATWMKRTTREEREIAVWHMLTKERPRMPHFATVLDRHALIQIVEWMRNAFHR